MGLDLFDILAVIFGVLFTIRKLDAQRRERSEFPHVAPAAFAIWQKREVSVYGLGLMACFSKVVAKLILVYGVGPSMGYPLLRTLGMTVDLSWLVLLIVTLVRAHFVSQRRRELGIVLGGFVVSEDDDAVSEELREARASLKEGELERANYQLRQVTLDADESQKGVAFYLLGQCLLQQDRPDEARRAFADSLQADPSLVGPQEALRSLDEA